MQWDDLLGHEQQQEWFRTALASRRLATSFLFVGPDGIGKRTFARLLAKSSLCRQTAADELTHCGGCEDCAQVDASTHPDLIEVAKPAEKAFVPIELLIGEREKRMREGLCHDISLRPYAGRRKIAILDDADMLNSEGANCLLKTLEEPPTNSLLVLIGTSLQRQLPTIRSRCQAILFRRLENEQLASLIHRGALISSEDEVADSLTVEQALSLAQQSGGSLSNARMIADADLREFQQSLSQSLTNRQIAIPELIKKFTAIVDAAGKDNRAKRERMKVLFQMAANIYRDCCLEDQSHDMSSGQKHKPVGPRSAIQCWNRCLSAIEQVDRNANQAGLIEAWTTDLVTLSGK